jgi:chaperonin GroES
MAKGLKPLGSKVLIERLEAEEKTAGGIVLPDTAKEKPKRGIVKATGPGKLLDNGSRAEMQLKEGDEVVFTTYAGTEITVNNEEFIIMEESDILAVIA